MSQNANLPAEEDVLGAMLLGAGHAIDTAAETLTPGDFWRDSHGLIFQACLDLHEAGVIVTPISVADELDKRGKLKEIGGSGRIAELAGIVPSASAIAHNAKIVRDLSLARRLRDAGQTITHVATERLGEVDDMLALAEQALTSVTSRNASRVEDITADLDELVEELREAIRTGEPITGELTGYTALDELLLGLWPGQLVLIAARPSMGKSTLALNIAENFADRGIAVHFNSLEMSRRELLTRSLSRAAAVDGMHLLTGQLTHDEGDRLKRGIEIVQARKRKLMVDADGDTTVQKLSATASRLKRTDNIGLIVVDYLQLMHVPGTTDNRAADIGTISRGLKMLAMRLNIPIIALSQMNRGIEQRQDKRPTLSDLRESGALEQDADVVVFIHDESAYDPDKPPNGEVDLIVAKNRRGPKDTAKMLYTRRLSSFLNAGQPTPKETS